MIRSSPATRTRAWARVLVFLALLLLPAAGARAQDPEIRFTVRPANPGDTPETVAWLVHEADPGAAVRDAVIVENLGDVRTELIVYAADGVTTPQGEFAVEPEEAPDVTVAPWVTLGLDRVSLDPGESKRVSVLVEVPDNATPGDYPGAVVARTAEPIAGPGINTHLAVGARLYMTVKGELVEELTVHGLIVRVEDGRPLFLLDVENTGNTLLDVGGTYSMEGLFGIGGGEGTVDPPATLVPGARATKEIAWPDRLFGGPYGVRFDLTYGSGKTATVEASFFVMPSWPVLLAISLLLLALVAAVVLGVRRVLRSRSTGRSEPKRPVPSPITTPAPSLGRPRSLARSQRR